MAVRLAALLPRAVIVALVWILGTAAFTWPRTTRSSAPRPPNPAAGAAAAQPSWSCRRSAARPTSSPRGSSRTPASPGACRLRARLLLEPRHDPEPRCRHARRRHRRADVIAAARARRRTTSSARPVDSSPYRGTAIRLAGLAAVTDAREEADAAKKAKPAKKPVAKPKRVAKKVAKPKRRKPNASQPRPPAFTRRRRAQGAARRDHAAGPRPPARALGRQPPEDRRQRPALALPARVDRHRREVRLVARRPGARRP